MAREIPLTKGFVAIVDDEDYALVSQWKWSANPRKYRRRDGTLQVYAHRAPHVNGRCTTLQLHRFLMDAPAGVRVDHVNGDGLDNRRCNLRFATAYQNAVNRGPLGTNRFGFIGVRQDRRGRFFAEMRHHGRHLLSSRCGSIEEAARAYDRLASLHRGDFAVLNFPEAA